MIQLNFQSKNFFELGKLLGQVYKTNGFDLTNFKMREDLYKKQIQVYQTYYPEMLDELNGICSIVNFDLEKLLYYFLTDEILYYQRILEHYKNKIIENKACTIFTYNFNDNLFIGRNYDWLAKVEDIFQLYKVNNLKSYTYVAITDMGIVSPKKIDPKYQIYQVDDAINEKGLFIGITFAYANYISTGLLPTHVTKLVAEKCSTLDDVINIFKNVPIAIPKNFFIADKFCNVAIVEHMSSYKFKIVYPKDNILIKTNHYLNHEFINEDIILDLAPSHTSFIRYFEVLQKIKSIKKFTFNKIPKILRDKDSYLFQNTKIVKTIWTLALDMNNSKYKIYYQKKGKNKSYNIII